MDHRNRESVEKLRISNKKHVKSKNMDGFKEKRAGAIAVRE